MTVHRDKRRKGRPWVVDITYVDRRNGKKRRYYRNAKLQTADGARSEDRMLLAKYAELGFIPEPEAEHASTPNEELTFAAAVKLFETTGKLKLKPSTQYSYRKTVDKYLLERFGSMPLSKITRSSIAEFDTELIKLGLGNSTRNNVLMPLRTILRNAVEQGRHEGKFEFPKQAPVKTKVYEPPTPELVEKLVAITPYPGKVAMALLAYAGLRAGEVRGLRWQDVNLEGGALVVRRTLTHGVETTPKSGHERTVPLAPALLDVLTAAAQNEPAPEHPVAPFGGTMEPYTEDQLRTLFLKALKAAGARHMRLHDLRHFFVSRCFAGGAAAPTVQKLAGHSQLIVTQRYAHTNDAAMREAVQVFARKAS